MKILVAVPCMDQVPARFAQSIATLQKTGECVIGFQVGSLVYLARENLAASAIEMGADYILWLDSDMVFNPDTLIKLIADREEGDIISGVYYRRVSPFTPVLYEKLSIEDGKASWKEFKDLPEEIFEAEGIGFGCCLTPTSVCADVLAKYGCMFTPINGTGEDLSFCWRARQLGYKIVVDPDITLGHVGSYVITDQFYNVFKSAKTE